MTALEKKRIRYRLFDKHEALKTIQRSEALECNCCTDKGHCPEYKSGDACVNDRVRKLHKEELNE